MKQLENLATECDSLKQQLASARELYIEKADLDARLEQAREQGREEARKGIVRALSGVAVTHECRADDCERVLSDRSEALLYAMATRSAADIARNWKPEATK